MFEIYRDSKKIMELSVLSDKMPVLRYDLEVPYEVEITKRDEWVNQNTAPCALGYYTDGSRNYGLVGMGVMVSLLSILKRVG
jgi:hypothetical protein